MPAPALEIRARRNQPLGMPPAHFLRDYWQKHPLLIRNAFPDFAPPLSADELAGLACTDGALARIVARSTTASSFRGRRRAQPATEPGIHPALPKNEKMDSGLRRNDEKWKVQTGPFDDSTFAKLPKSRWTLLVQDVDKWDADTMALLGAFAFIPSWRIDDVMISYAADAGGVGAHVDQYDVFLLQAMGRRHWSIDTRPNPPVDFRDDVELKLLRRFHPTHAWTLARGDMLYLPPGVPHDGVAVGECMTCSIGMRAPAASELLLDFSAHLAETMPESHRFADPDLDPATNAGEIDAAALVRARRALGGVAADVDDEVFADWFGEFITRYRAVTAAEMPRHPCDRVALAADLPRCLVQRDPWSRFAWRPRGRDARLYAAGAAFDAPPGWARALAGSAHKVDGTRLARLPQRARGITLVADLIDAGHLRLRWRRSRGR